MDVTECPICSEKYNKTSRKKIICLCEKECCRTCVKRYIETKTEDVHCMYCKIKWNRDFVHKNFEKTYIIKDYKTYRENILFEREVGMLPATQPFVEKEIEIEQKREELLELDKIRNQLNQKYYEKIREIDTLKNNRQVEKKKYVRKCPNNSCQGFLSTQLKCELCNVWVCSECREIKGQARDAEHSCNPDILETVKLLINDTKPCPSCSAMIYKIEGCNQMFCTECHVAFDWNSLRIETGTIHNPHYFEWQRRRNNEMVERNPNDVLCGRELDNFIFSRIQDKIMGEYNNTSNIVPNNMFNNFILFIVENNDPEFLETARYQLKVYKNLSMNKTPYHCHKECFINMMRIYKHYRKDQQRLDLIIKLLGEIRIAVFSKKIEQISNIIRETIHIRHIEMRRWDTMDRLNNNLDLRINFMRNKVTEDEFKFTVQKRDKESQRNIECGNVLRMYISCMTDLVYRIYDDIETYEPILDEMHELRKYTNQCLQNILVTYNSSMKHHINEVFVYCLK